MYIVGLYPGRDSIIKDFQTLIRNLGVGLATSHPARYLAAHLQAEIGSDDFLIGKWPTSSMVVGVGRFQ